VPTTIVTSFMAPSLDDLNFLNDLNDLNRLNIYPMHIPAARSRGCARRKDRIEPR
jgi:hypothetical protein